MRDQLSRKEMLRLMGYTGLEMVSRSLSPSFPIEETMLTRSIPSSGEQLPVVGLGTWIQFNVGSPESERAPIRQVLQLMAEKAEKSSIHLPCMGTQRG